MPNTFLLIYFRNGADETTNSTALSASSFDRLFYHNKTRAKQSLQGSQTWQFPNLVLSRPQSVIDVKYENAILKRNKIVSVNKRGFMSLPFLSIVSIMYKIFANALFFFNDVIRNCDLSDHRCITFVLMTRKAGSFFHNDPCSTHSLNWCVICKLKLQMTAIFLPII